MAVANAIKAAKGEPVDKTVIVPVLGLSRTDPAAAEEFRKGLEAIQ
jgi:hypothetical protein